MKALFRSLVLPGVAALCGFIVGMGSELRSPTSGAESRMAMMDAKGGEEVAPADAVAGALKLARSSQGLRDYGRLAPLLEAMDAAQMKAFMDQLAPMVGSYSREPAAILKWCMERDPIATAKWMEPRWRRCFAQDQIAGDRPYGQVAFDSVIEAWVAVAPEAAIEMLGRHPHHGQTERLLKLAFESWSEKDPRVIGGMLLKFPASDARLAVWKESLVKAVYGSTWRIEDELVAYATTLPECRERDEFFETFMAGRYLPLSLKAMEALENAGIHDPRVWHGFLDFHTIVDAEAPARWAKKAEGKVPAACVRAAVVVWAKKEPAAALDWAGSRDRLEVASTTEGAAQMGLEELANFPFEKLTHTGFIAEPAEALFETTLRWSPVGTLEWLSRQPPSPERDAWVERASDLKPVEIYGEAEKKRYFDALTALILELPLESAAQSAYQLTVRSTPGETIAWAQSLDSGPIRERAWEGVGEASETLPELPPGPDRDALLSGAARRQLGEREPMMEAALKCAMQIGSESKRREVFDEVWQIRLGHEIDHADQVKELQDVLEKTEVPGTWKEMWRSRIAALEGKLPKDR